MRWLHLKFNAPLGSFGGETIDSFGVTHDFPTKSLLVGLFANSLGWTRSMRSEHQQLQDRIIFGAMQRHQLMNGRLTDFQTVRLEKHEKAWTTSGIPAVRLGGLNTYTGSHLRRRDYLADMKISVVVRLEPDNQHPKLEEIAHALDYPARPLFIGRKPCLPSGYFVNDWVNADDVYSALCGLANENEVNLRASWPASEGGEDHADRITLITDERNWITGIHGGGRRVCEGRVTNPK